MAYESFENPETARFLNEHFVSIKLDREERPDIDHLYMESCTAINGHGGWPLSVFINPDKSPFFAGTYYPPQSFLEILKKVQNLWRKNRESLSRAGADTLSFITAPETRSTMSQHNLLEEGYRAYEQSFEPRYGGFSRAPKFPSAQNLLFLLRYSVINPESRAKDMVCKTLSSMACGGLHDHLGGGFFRYSTDGLWHIPHYEKMLYDNAMLLIAYTESGVCYNEPEFLETARSCAEFCVRELKAPDGGFYTALDADSSEGEGAYYLWSQDAALHTLGGEKGQAFCADYHIGKNPSLPHRIDSAEYTPLPGDIKSRLMSQRESRTRPHRDEKILAGNNALMAAALAIAGRLLDDSSWISLAEQTADFILDRLCTEGRLKASYFEGKCNHKATLDDYAFFIWALIELYESTFEPKWLGLALNWNAHMIELFGSSGGMFLSGRDVKDIPARQKVYADGPLPSGNAVAAMNLIRLHTLCGAKEYSRIAEDILTAARGVLEAYPIACAGFLTAILLSGNISKLTVSHGSGQVRLMKAAAGFRPFMQVIAGTEDRPEAVSRLTPSARNSLPINGNAAAYYCDRNGCRMPVSDEKQLIDILR